MSGRWVAGATALGLAMVWAWGSAAGAPAAVGNGTGAAAEAPGPVDPQDILAGEREQQRIAALTGSVAQRILNLLKTMRANRAADNQTIERWEHAVRELTALSQQNMVRAMTALSRARRVREADIRDFLRTASLEQREIISRLQALLNRIEKHVAFARIVDTVEQLIKDQDRAKERTAEVAREVLGKPPEGVSDDERQRMDDLRQEQEALRETYEGLGGAVDDLLKADAGSAEREAAAAARVAGQMRADRADRDMRQAAAALAERKALDAATAQARALEKLRRLRDLLRQDERAHLRRLDQAAAELDLLIRRQRETKRQTGQLGPDTAEERLRDLIKEQSDVARATGDLAATTEAVSPRAADSLARARDHQEQAGARMAAHEPGQAVQDQQAALDRLEDARAALDRDRKDLARRLAEPGPIERLERAAQDLERAVAAQERARQEALRMAAQADQGHPPDRQELNRAEAQQRDLAEATRDVQRRVQEEGAADITRTLNAALKAQETAAEHLKGERPAEAAPEQQRAVDELKKAGGALQYQLKLAREAQERAEAAARLQEEEQGALDALGEAAKRLRDLDSVLGEQEALRADGRELGQRMTRAEGAKPIARPEAVAAARGLAERQRDLRGQTAGLGDLLGELDRDVARNLDDATGPQGRAAEHLQRTDPQAADPEQAKAVEHLRRARGHLARKFSDIVELLKRLEAERREMAKGEPGEAGPAPPPGQDQPGASVDDLLKLASALVDIDRLRTRQGDTKEATDAEAKKSAAPDASPDEAEVARLARQQSGHAADADELAGRMERWDPAGDLGTAEARTGVRQAGSAMREATQDLTERKPAPAVGAQTKALTHLNTAVSAAQEAFARAAQQAQQQMQQAQEHATDPTEYDPMNRPPGDVRPEDTVRNARWNVGLPPRIRDEIISALSDRFPPGYEELLRRYYGDLSQEAWEQLDLRRP